MSKCLILLTNVSPNTEGESFVKNELLFHSKVFEKVIVIPIERANEQLINNNYPCNVDVAEAPEKSGKKTRFVDAFRGFLNILIPNKALLQDSKVIRKSLPKLLFANYFESKAKRCAKYCLKILGNYDFSQFDEVVIYSFWFFTTCRVGIYLKEYLGNLFENVPFVTRAHGYDIYPYTNELNYLPERLYLAEHVDFIYPCSKSGEIFLKSEIPAYKEKIQCSYLGTFDEGLNQYKNDFHIVTCSHTVSVKRLDKLVEALSGLREKKLKIKWTHIGDGVLQEKIKHLAEEKLDFMEFEFLGRMDNPQVMEYYKNNPVSLFVNVSESEGLPVSIMEAASFGIPVLATDVGGTHEIVYNDFNGKLIPKDFTKEEFSDALLSIYNLEENEYKEMRINARKFWKENFDAEKNYTLFSETIANIN